jgi:hypothetical protein
VVLAIVSREKYCCQQGLEVVSHACCREQDKTLNNGLAYERCGFKGGYYL